jgi:NitT/TauT family transport system substrate-binding protein
MHRRELLRDVGVAAAPASPILASSAAEAHRRTAWTEGRRMMAKLGSATLGFVIAMLGSGAPLRAQDTVIMGTVGSASANLWPVFIGLDKGFFAAENIKIDLVYVPASAAAIQQLAAGSLNMTISTGLVDPIRAIDQGAAIAIVRFEVQAPPYVMMAKPNVKSLNGLKGKVISVGGAKDITRVYAERMLAPHGLKPGDYDFVYAGATTARAQALLSGAVDAAILLPPSNFQIGSAGYNDLGLTIDYAPELAFSGTVVNRAWAGRNEPTTRRVLAAQNKSIEYLYDDRNRDEAIRILVAASGLKIEDVDKSYDFFRKNNFFDRSGKISQSKMNALLDALVSLGDLRARGDIERFLLRGVAQLSD